MANARPNGRGRITHRATGPVVCRLRTTTPQPLAGARLSSVGPSCCGLRHHCATGAVHRSLLGEPFPADTAVAPGAGGSVGRSRAQ